MPYPLTLASATTEESAVEVVAAAAAAAVLVSVLAVVLTLFLLLIGVVAHRATAPNSTLCTHPIQMATEHPIHKGL